MSDFQKSNIILLHGPVVQLKFDSVSDSTNDIRELIKFALDNLQYKDSVLARKLGVAIVYLISYRQVQLGIEPNRSNIHRELDQYYYVLQNEDLTRNLQCGIDDSIEVIRNFINNLSTELLIEELQKI